MEHMQVQAVGYLLDHVVGILSLAKVRQLKQSPSPSCQRLVSSRCLNSMSSGCFSFSGPKLQVVPWEQEALLPILCHLSYSDVQDERS